MELIEGSETLPFRTQTPGNYPKENILYKEHGESLKSRKAESVLKNCKLFVYAAIAYMFNLLCKNVLKMASP
jgi:hypothetical protein